MVTPPLSPSAVWMGRYLRSLTEGLTHEESVEKTNNSLSHYKETARFSLLAAKGEPVTLSVAVEGGAKKLKNRELIEEIRLSEHGDWRRIHSGALEACLGRTPFFRHIEPEILKVYSDTGNDTLSRFNNAILKAILTFLIGNAKPQDLKRYFTDPVLRERGKELAATMNPDISSLEYLSLYGREALLGFMELSISED